MKTALVFLAGLLVGAFAQRLWQPVEPKPAVAAPAPAPVVLPIKMNYGLTQPLPQRVELDPAKVALGERLFHDARLSGNDTVSCASCHNLATAGVDRQPRSFGMNNREGEFNAPTVFNSGFNFAQFWDGRAATLEAQIDGPIHNPKEMATTWPQVAAKLAQDQAYPALFAKAYPDGVTAANVKDAIATFERSLVTPNSRFDRYLRGETAVLSAQEIQGYALFRSYGCSSCHQGVNLGGNMFQKMGLMGDYFADRGKLTEADRGRYNVDHRPESLHMFKVPSLRNVALTAPYFHDGSTPTLAGAIAVMAKYQLGRPMPTADLKAIAAFLEALNGEYRGKPL